MEQTFDANAKYPRHLRAHTTGGIHLKDSAAKVTEIGLSVLKTLGVKIREGGVFDLLTISRPAIISYHKTYLESMAREYINTKYLNKAAECTDPAERMKWVVCWLLSGIGRCPAEMQNNGPLNPILGETYFAEKKDGTKVYCEQISHHPPVSAFLIYGPNNSYKLYGTGELEAKLNGFNHVLAKRSGKVTIEFRDGTKIVFTNPEVRIDGILMGDRRLNFINALVFLDRRQKISAEVNFLYEAQGTIHRVASGFKKLFGHHKEKLPTDAFEVVIFNYDKDKDGEAKKKILMEGSGSWVSHVQVNNKLLWQVDDSLDDPWIENMQGKLLSDSIFREDAKFIKMRDFDNAQKAKDVMENKQRNDAKLRKEHAKKH